MANDLASVKIVNGMIWAICIYCSHNKTSRLGAREHQCFSCHENIFLHAREIARASICAHFYPEYEFRENIHSEHLRNTDQFAMKSNVLNSLMKRHLKLSLAVEK